MDRNNGGSRSGAQTAAALAQLAKSLTRIIRAAMLAGIKGAALQTVKEGLPLIVKIIGWTLLFFVMLPLLIFVSLPNIFFGFDNASSENIATMTVQAMELGSTYMSLEEFQKAQMDTFVTRLVAEYEEDGITIDEIEITSDLDEQDLYWIISINSVDGRQDLSVMTATDIQNLGIVSLTYVPSLSQVAAGEGLTKTVLKVDFDALDPEVLMEELAFDEEEKNWARAFQKTLSDSDALTEYGDYFTGTTPGYGGDGGYGGDIIYGGDGDNAIDISGFVSPNTKNNLDLVNYALQAHENGWGYVWGTFGNVLTDSLFAYKLQQYPDGVGNYESFIRDNWLGRRTADCVGLIKGYGWLDVSDLTIGYAENGMPDYGANQMYNSASVKGTMDTMPDIPGLAVWKQGHIGVYVGDGMVVEAMGTKSGVVMTELNGRGWQGWCEIAFIDYIEE